MIRFLTVVVFLAGLLFGVAAARAQEGEVWANIAIGIDRSTSMTADAIVGDMLNRAIQDTALAVQSPLFLRHVRERGAIGLMVYLWSDDIVGSKALVPWVRLSGLGSGARQIAQALQAVDIRSRGSTVISSGIEIGIQHLQQAPWGTFRSVIDLTTDCGDADYSRLRSWRDRAGQTHVVVNFLIIREEFPNCGDQMLAHGASGFVRNARSTDETAEVLIRKLIDEIG